MALLVFLCDVLALFAFFFPMAAGYGCGCTEKGRGGGYLRALFKRDLRLGGSSAQTVLISTAAFVYGTS